MRSLFLLLSVALTGCGASSATFETKFATSDSPMAALEEGAPKVGCRHVTEFHGDEFHCEGDKTITLTDGGGHLEATCEHMSRSDCEELLQRMYRAGRSGG